MYWWPTESNALTKRVSGNSLWRRSKYSPSSSAASGQGSAPHELLDRFCAWGLAQAERQGLTVTRPDAGPDRAPRSGPVGSSRGGSVGSVPGRRGDRAPDQCT
jgi:hypothetical protein